MEKVVDDCAGYDFDFVDGLQEDQFCPICKGVIRDPLQIVECGHQCCEYCFTRSQRDNRRWHCPVDGRDLPDNNAFFKDVAFKKKIRSLLVKCKQHGRGCKWIGEIRNYLSHYEICQFEDEVCKDCSMRVQRRFIEEHKNNVCEERIVICQYCLVNEFPHCDLQEHVEKCHFFPIECPQECGGDRILRKEVESHVANRCPRTVVSCPYSVIGCTFKDMRSTLEPHIRDSIEQHLSQTLSLASKNAELENEVGELRKKVELSNEAQHKLASENLELRKAYSDFTQKSDLAFKSIITRLSAVEESQKHVLESKRKETEDMRSLSSKNAELENEVGELRKKVELSNEAQNKLASENLELRNKYSDFTQKGDLAFKSITRLLAVKESQKHILESKCKETEDMRCKLETDLRDVKEQLNNVTLKLTKSERNIQLITGKTNEVISKLTASQNEWRSFIEEKLQPSWLSFSRRLQLALTKCNETEAHVCRKRRRKVAGSSPAPVSDIDEHHQ